MWYTYKNVVSKIQDWTKVFKCVHLLVEIAEGEFLTYDAFSYWIKCPHIM